MIMTVHMNQPSQLAHEPHMGHYNDNQICQWYCCSCGQSYGSIIYKDTGDNSTSNLSNNEDTSSTYQTLNDYLLKSLKHYSQLIYNHYQEDNDRADNAMTETCSAHEGATGSNSAAVSPILEAHPQSGANTSGENNYVIDSPSRNNTTTPVSEDSSSNYNFSPNSKSTPHKSDSNILLQVPTRFTCHRCDHMMCPYCLKVRYKDLANN